MALAYRSVQAEVLRRGGRLVGRREVRRAMLLSGATTTQGVATMVMILLRGDVQRLLQTDLPLEWVLAWVDAH